MSNLALFFLQPQGATDRPALAHWRPLPRRGSTEITLKGGCIGSRPQPSYRFADIADTIFENTNKTPRDWFKVTHLMLASKKGMSALQIMRCMGFGRSNIAWDKCRKLRAALVGPETKLGGLIEVDETFIGGKDKSKRDKRGRGRKHAPSTKVPVISAVQLKGHARFNEDIFGTAIVGC